MNRFRRKPNEKGFTMIELMVVVVIVGVLAAIAIPIYGKYIKNARVTEATGRMGEIITSAKSWAQEHPDGAGIPQWPGPVASGATLGVIDCTSDAQANFDYSITSAAGNAQTTSLVVKAVGKNQMVTVTSITLTVPNINLNAGPPAIVGL